LTNKIIVLGGSGFLGSHIIQALQKSNMGEVTCGDIVSNSSLSCEYIKLDMLEANDITKKLDNYDTIINCTGQITRPFNICFKLNSVGINNLTKALSGKSSRLIHISTVAVYGSAENCNEESPLNPETNYATAKVFAEQILQENYVQGKLTILRLSNLYGSRQMKGVFAYLLRSYHSDRKLNFNNDGNLTRSFMHVEDCADIIVEISKNPKLNQIYNVKGYETYSVKELVQEFENRFKVTFETSYNETLSWENIKYLDNSKLRGSINLKPQWQLFDFIEKKLGNQTYA
jgi:nucleoside-diphosphate-sugar epimerase